MTSPLISTLQRFRPHKPYNRVVSVVDLPPAPPKRKRGAEAEVEDVNLEDIDESEFDPQIQQVLQQQQEGEGRQDGDGQQQQQLEEVPQQQSSGQDLIPNDGEDGELDPGVQQVLEIQLQAGQGQEQLNTQEFENRFFLNT